MPPFKLDDRLTADCHELTVIDNTHVLLMNNALLPWIILVPHVSQIELHQLDESTFSTLMQLQQQTARFIELHFTIDKINTAAIGNVVSQLHVHVIGRRKDDHCWPGVVWGNPTKEPYPVEQVKAIRQQFVMWTDNEAG